MAAETLSSVSAALSQTFAEPLNKQWQRLVPLAALVPVKKGFGKNAAFDVEFTGATAATVAEGSDVQGSEYNSDVNVPAILSWGHYRSSFQVSETELDAAASSLGTPAALQDLFGDRIVGCGAILAQKISTDMFSATGTDGSSNPTIVGLSQGPLESTGSYASIARGTYSEWASTPLANGGAARPLTLDLLHQMDQNIFTGSGEPYNLIVTDAGTFRKYAGLFEPIRRAAGPSPVTLGSPDAMGIDGMYFKGVPVIRDPKCPAGYMFFLNTNLIETKYLPRVFSPQDAVMAQMAMATGSNAGTVTNMTQIPIRIAVLAKTGDSVKVSLKTSVAMLVRRPNAMGYIKDISIT